MSILTSSGSRLDLCSPIHLETTKSPRRGIEMRHRSLASTSKVVGSGSFPVVTQEE